jgi:hypothetical protein
MLMYTMNCLILIPVYHELCNPDPGIISHANVYHGLCNLDPGIISHAYVYHELFNPDPGVPCTV